LLGLPANELIASDFPSKINLLAADGSVRKVVDLSPLVGSYTEVWPRALTSEGQIVVSYRPNGLARLDVDGTLDPTFDIAAAKSALDGRVLSYDFASVAVVCQADGRLITSTIKEGNYSETLLRRLFAAGRLDGSFASTVSGTISSMTLDRQGALLIGGTFAAVNGTSRRNLARIDTAAPPPASDLQLFAPKQEGGCFSVSIGTMPDRRYILQSRASLTDAGWTALSPVAGNGAVITLQDTNASAPRRFYRIQVE
jgi:hypothetical protein